MENTAPQNDVSAKATKSLFGWPKVVLFGDSLTQYGYSKDGCWVASIADKLQRTCDVINRGFSGYNTRWCQMLLSQVISPQDGPSIAAFVIFLGANDSTLPDAIQHVSCEEYKQNLTQMVKYLMDIGIEKNKIILVSPPPCVEEKWKIAALEKGVPMSQDNKYKQQYAIACRSVASHIGCPFVDAYMNFMQEKDWKEMLNDGLHFSEKGALFLSQLVWPHIEALTQHLPTIFPLWRDVDPKHPESSLISNE